MGHVKDPGRPRSGGAVAGRTDGPRPMTITALGACVYVYVWHVRV